MREENKLAYYAVYISFGVITMITGALAVINIYRRFFM